MRKSTTTKKKNGLSQPKKTRHAIGAMATARKRLKASSVKRKLRYHACASQFALCANRNGAFEPIIVPKGQIRFDGFDGKTLSLYSRGMSVHDIQAQLQDLHGVEVSSSLISKVTDAVEEERKLWQNRGLDRVYPRCYADTARVVYFDEIVVKVRQDGRVINKAIHLALAVNLSNNKELLGSGGDNEVREQTGSGISRWDLAQKRDVFGA